MPSKYTDYPKVVSKKQTKASMKRSDTQIGNAMKILHAQVIASYSPKEESIHVSDSNDEQRAKKRSTATDSISANDFDTVSESSNSVVENVQSTADLFKETFRILARRIQKKPLLQTIPSTVPDKYSFSYPAYQSSNTIPLMNKEFDSISYSESYWDSQTFELLAFADNFVHYVGRSKQELMDGKLLLHQTAAPIARTVGQGLLSALVSSNIKTLEMQGAFFRESDARLVFLHHKMSFEGKYIRIQHFLETKCSDAFVLDGTSYAKQYEFDSNFINNVTVEMDYMNKKIGHLLNAIQYKSFSTVEL